MLPGLVERPALMSLWSDCSGGLFHSTLDRVLKHMHLSFALPLQQILPHSPDSGSHTNGTLLISRRRHPQSFMNVTSAFICLCSHVCPVIRMVVSEMVDRSELASSSCPSPCSLAQDVLTVFQFHHYSVEHDVTDMEQHLLDLAKESKNGFVE